MSAKSDLNAISASCMHQDICTAFLVPQAASPSTASRSRTSSIPGSSSTTAASWRARVLASPIATAASSSSLWTDAIGWTRSTPSSARYACGQLSVANSRFCLLRQEPAVQHDSVRGVAWLRIVPPMQSAKPYSLYHTVLSQDRRRFACCGNFPLGNIPLKPSLPCHSCRPSCCRSRVTQSSTQQSLATWMLTTVTARLTLRRSSAWRCGNCRLPPALCSSNPGRTKCTTKDSAINAVGIGSALHGDQAKMGYSSLGCSLLSWGANVLRLVGARLQAKQTRMHVFCLMSSSLCWCWRCCCCCCCVLVGSVSLSHCIFTLTFLQSCNYIYVAFSHMHSSHTSPGPFHSHPAGPVEPI